MMNKLNPLKKVKVALVVSTLLSCTGAIASIRVTEPPGSTLKNLDLPFQVAVIKNAVGSTAIVKGEYEKSISDLTTTDSAFETQLGLCAANVKLGKYKLADIACSKAIEYISTEQVKTSRSAFLASIAYSNRGIVKHYLRDKVGAFKDFNMALSFDANNVVLMNLKALNVATLKKEILATTTAMNK